MTYIDPIERTKRHFRKDEMLWVLRDSLDQDLVIQVMSKCGLRPSPEKTYQEHLKELRGRQSIGKPYHGRFRVQSSGL